MKPRFLTIGLLVALALAACHGPRREARRMARRAERLFDSMPDSTATLLDSVLRMPVLFSERERMGLALLQGEALFGDRGQEVPPVMDDELDDRVFQTASPDLEHAAGFYARKKRYAEAARAALYSGLVQQHYGEKQLAMKSFKDAERYGAMAADSLTVAQAEYWMGKMLFRDGLEREALTLLEDAERKTGHRLAEKALVRNLSAGCCLVLGDYENAELHIQQCMALSQKSHLDKVRRKAMNNYAVLYQLQGKHGQAVACLRQNASDSDLGDKDLLLLNLNLGDVFFDEGEMDSAACYYKRVDSLLPGAMAEPETKVSAYSSLSRFAESRHDDSLALHYRKLYDRWLNEVRDKLEQNNVYGIQQKYDYETLQNVMGQKVIRRQRLTIILSIMVVLVVLAFAISQIRLARTRKLEAEAKSRLFLFMQRHDQLVTQHEEHMKTHAELLNEKSEKDKAYRELLHENAQYKEAFEEYARKYLDAKKKEQKAITKLTVYLKNSGDAASLNELKRVVYDTQSPWDAIYEVFDALYPNVSKTLKLQQLGLTDSEQKVFVLSFFDISRQDEADMLDTSVHSVDKLRNSVRKKLKNAEIGTPDGT